MITITESANKELSRAILEHKEQDPKVGEIYVRVCVQGGGCSGFKYNLSLEEGLTEKDEVFEVSGLKVAIDKLSAMYLEKTTLDFLDDLNHRGFKFSNPSATSTCGCGSSFNLG